ncbi:hypothetical protein GBAR_LOCUS21649 [Geodia barretti]|uniref:Uncharacterized protein n=1 Tax=Geodia barretti TaxID=519541 RepID=A0AA35X5T6_GEOBA|nr:hypothetical protein GBAR_LOCUS21649 [Geodia barretti]
MHTLLMCMFSIQSCYLKCTHFFMCMFSIQSCYLKCTHFSLQKPPSPSITNPSTFSPTDTS